MDKDILDVLFDPNVIDILALLEDSPKSMSFVSDKLDMTFDQIKQRLQELVSHGLIEFQESDNETMIVPNSKKLATTLEDNATFDGAIDGLTQIDTFLN